MLILDIGIWEKGLRSLFALLCQAIYPLIAWFFDLFYSIAELPLLAEDSIKPIYERVTMILAIIMVFYVTFEFVKYVVQPDAMTDKEKGASKIVGKMIIVVLLIAFVPTIFTGAWKLQSIILKNQVFSKIILGKVNLESGTFGRNFSSQMFSMFYSYDIDLWGEDKECAGIPCQTVVQYNLSTLLQLGTLKNLSMGINDSAKYTADSGAKEDVALITFDGLMAVVVGILIVYILLLYTIDTGVRYVQFIFLQVIAPIPIIGYLAPKKEGIFQKWVKQCITTYLDLFIRLAIIYFVMLISSILGTELGSLLDGIETAKGLEGYIYIVLILGLLLFAQKAPKMLKELFPGTNAASGNFGLKAGERVAPLAARAIGAGLGATRLVGGGISRAVNTARRNKAERLRSGMTRAEQKAERRQHKKDLRQANSNYKNAISDRKQAKKDGTYSGDKQKNIEKNIQQQRDNLTRAKSAVAADQNKKYRSAVAQGIVGAGQGLTRGVVEGGKATKLGDIPKQVKAGAQKDREAIAAREKWLDSGGGSTLDRMATSFEKKLGIVTDTERIASEIRDYDDKIKENKALSTIESDTKASRDDVENRANSKIEAMELKNKVNYQTDASGKRYIHGISSPLDIRDTDTVSDLYGRYKVKTEAAKSDLDKAIKSGQNVAAAEEAYKNAQAMEVAVKKHAMRNAFTQMLQHPEDPKNDAVALEKIENMKTKISIARNTPETMRAFEQATELDMENKRREINGNPNLTVQEKTKAIQEIEQKYTAQIEAFRSGKFEDYDQLDDIVVRLQNVADGRKRQNMEYEESKRLTEASAATAAAKSNDSASSGKK